VWFECSVKANLELYWTCFTSIVLGDILVKLSRLLWVASISELKSFMMCQISRTQGCHMAFIWPHGHMASYVHPLCIILLWQSNLHKFKVWHPLFRQILFETWYTKLTLVNYACQLPTLINAYIKSGHEEPKFHSRWNGIRVRWLNSFLGSYCELN
jgi:hypothetical protein